MNLFPPATTRASASGPSKEEVAHKKLPATASCAARAYVPLSGARTAGGSSALAAMELSRFSRDKKVHGHLPKLARFAFRIPSFLMPFAHHTLHACHFGAPLGTACCFYPTLHSGVRQVQKEFRPKGHLHGWIRNLHRSLRQIM